ncbi:type II toxin-antitoxin system HicB family antitoxin [Candidatus Nitrosotenuis cloacae]|jgi:predicted RNase H-like HicB family nuclease|uniref:type II toxin-antitoxin system HicB family antitoxin n=1 Tax=Candidatus Nitrosotenuis cloacae TaxID=1603555 RepID=UPI0022812CDC|nr:type II toxin-antitoxin system HicB family antitoxin [Candidatus Nitrosotenuis cloacae]
MKYRITLQRDEDGAYVARCQSLPGCVSQGRTRDDALENVKDAIRGYIQSLRKHGEPIPPVEEELVEVNV